MWQKLTKAQMIHVANAMARTGSDICGVHAYLHRPSTGLNTKVLLFQNNTTEIELVSTLKYQQYKLVIRL